MLKAQRVLACAGAVCFPPRCFCSAPSSEAGRGQGWTRRCIVERGAGQRGQCGGPPADAHAQRPHRPPRHRPWRLFAAAWGCRRSQDGTRGWWVVVCCWAHLRTRRWLRCCPPFHRSVGLPHAGVNYGFSGTGAERGQSGLSVYSNLAGVWRTGRHWLYCGRHSDGLYGHGY